MIEFGYIYAILNLITKQEYVGKTKNSMNRRIRGHLDALKRGVDTALCRSIRKYGVENFAYYILEECPVDQLNDREMHYILELDCYSSGLNMTYGGEDSPMLNPEVSSKVAKKLKGVPRPADVRKRISDTQKAHAARGTHSSQSPEARKLQSDTLKRNARLRELQAGQIFLLDLDEV